jgi:hypothetical protein
MKTRMELFQALKLGRSLAAAQWSWHRVTEFLEENRYDRVTLLRVRRGFDDFLLTQKK